MRILLAIRRFVFFIFSASAFILTCFCCNHEHSGLTLLSGKHNLYHRISGYNCPVCYYDAIMKRNNLINVFTLDSTMVIDLKYATEDNFMKTNMYGCLRKAYLLPDVAHRLVACQKFLRELHPEYSLVILDAARPLQIQRMMWDSLELPLHEKVQFLSNPAFGSLHNFGAAVDVSIVNAKGEHLDMGSHFDEIGEKSHPSQEWKLLQEGSISQEQIDNRILLRKVMRKGGFWGIQTEWWHFNAMTREAAAAQYQLIH